MTFLVTNISEGMRIACFLLEGDDNERYGCVEIEGRKSLRREERNMLTDEYEATVSLDGKWLPTQHVSIQ